MFITVTLSNPNCPHYGTITIAFPIEAKDEEVDRLDTRQLIEDLIASGSGIVTPYGVAFDNGMELRELYQGHAFPEYHDARAVLQGFLAAEPEAVNAKTADTLFFPMPDRFLPRALIRSAGKRRNAAGIFRL